MGAALHAEFGEEGGDVVFDGFLGEEEAVADLAVGEAFADEGEDAAFLVGEAGQGVGGGGLVAHAAHDAAGGFGVEEGLAGGDGADGADEVGAADLLEDVAGGAGHDGVEEGFVVAEAGEHEAGELGHFGADVAADADAVAVGEADVEDGDVGFEGGDAGQGGGGGAGFADDGDAGFGFEEVADAHPDDFVIVEQEYPDRLRCAASSITGTLLGQAGPPRTPGRANMHVFPLQPKPEPAAQHLARAGEGPRPAGRAALPRRPGYF